MSELGQSLPKRDVRVTSAYPSISDIILRRVNNAVGHLRTFLDVRVTSAFLISPDMIHSWHLLYRRGAAGSIAAARSSAECWGEDAAS
jgi:hypothetical protein